ncbi:MAG: hypothetical protein V9E88_09455 [Ferruginibacter sp.]
MASLHGPAAILFPATEEHLPITISSISANNINVNTNCTGCPGLNFTNTSTGVITQSGGSNIVIGNADNMIFNNDGIVNVNTGTIIFRGQGNHTGTFNIPPSRILRFEQNNGVPQNFNSGSSLQGSGTVGLNSGNTSFNSGCLYAPTLNTVHLGGTVNWNAPDISINRLRFLRRYFIWNRRIEYSSITLLVGRRMEGQRSNSIIK